MYSKKEQQCRSQIEMMNDPQNGIEEKLLQRVCRTILEAEIRVSQANSYG